MKKAFTLIFNIVSLILVIDALGFMAWAMSGQFPVDNFYIGSITMHIIKLFV